MEIIEDILQAIHEDAPVTEVRQGLHSTAVAHFGNHRNVGEMGDATDKRERS
jgi:hypothetical protein